MDQMPHAHHVPGAPVCPHCSKLIDGASAADGTNAFPKDGDRTLCFYCLNPSVFVAGPFGLTLRAMTSEEDEEFRSNHGDTIEMLRRVRAEVRRSRD